MVLEKSSQVAEVEETEMASELHTSSTEEALVVRLDPVLGVFLDH